MANKMLWVIGNRSGSLGEQVYKSAPFSDNKYSWVLGTDREEVDVTSQNALDGYCRNIARRYPTTSLDVAYCAGVNHLAGLGELDMKNVEDTFDVNVIGFIRLMDSIAAIIPNANVVAVASDAARTAMRRSISYCSSKAALVHAVKCAARELAPRIRVNAVSPSIIDGTPMSLDVDARVMEQRGWSRQEMTRYEMAAIPMARRATRSEVAQVILSTLNGPKFQTGANIEITGGK